MDNEREGLKLDEQTRLMIGEVHETKKMIIQHCKYINKEDAKAIVKHLTEQFKLLDEPTVKPHAPVDAWKCPCIVCNGGKKKC